MTHLGDRIAAFVDGQLPADERRSAESHVAVCEQCRRKVREQRLLKSRMNSLGDVEAPQHLLASLSDVERLATSDVDHPGRFRRHLRSTPLRALVAVTGASVTVTAFAYGIGGPERDETSEVTPAVGRFTAQFEQADPATVDHEATHGSGATQVTDVGVSPLTPDVSRPADADDEEAIEVLRTVGVPPEYLKQLVRTYQVWLGSVGAVSGRPAVEVRVGRGDQTITSFWIDSLSYRLLRRIDFGSDGSVSASYDYSVGDAPGPHAAGPAAGESRISADTLRALTNSGWSCHDKLGDGLARVQSHWVDIGSEHIVRLTYTDGLSRLSLYEQRGALDASGLDGFEPRYAGGDSVWIRDGDPSVAVWATDGVVYTAITDAGANRLWNAVGDLPHESPDRETGSMDRISTGLSRMGSWMSPA